MQNHRLRAHGQPSSVDHELSGASYPATSRKRWLPSRPRRLPGDALIEFVVWRWLGLRVGFPLGLFGPRQLP
jgi:hypothetical protein